MRKKEVVIHVDGGNLEELIEVLDVMEGVELVGINFIDRAPVVDVRKTSSGRLPSKPGKEKHKRRKEKAVQRRNKRRNTRKGKGEIENKVMTAVNDQMKEQFTIVDLAAAAHLDTEVARRAVSRLVRKGVLINQGGGLYQMIKDLALAG